MLVYRIIEWITLNLDKVILFSIVIFILSLTSSLTTTIRSIKDGIREGLTPLGAFVMLVLIIIVYVIYKSISS